MTFRDSKRSSVGGDKLFGVIAIDENGGPAFNEPLHPPVGRSHLDDAFSDLDRATISFDDDGEGRSLDYGRKHRRVDGEMRHTGVLHFEEHCSQLLDDAGKAGWPGCSREAAIHCAERSQYNRNRAQALLARWHR